MRAHRARVRPKSELSHTRHGNGYSQVPVSISASQSSAPVPATSSVGQGSSEWREHLIRAVASVALVYGSYWIFWRWTNTINTAPHAVVPSVILLLAETWAYLGLCFFVMLTWRL